MIVNENPTYKCEHCKKVYQRANACLHHEENLCRKNPKFAHICFGCAHLTTEVLPQYYDSFDGERMRNMSVFYCDVHEIALHPGYVKEPIEFGEPENRKMPTDCDQWKDALKHDMDHLFNL